MNEEELKQAMRETAAAIDHFLEQQMEAKREAKRAGTGDEGCRRCHED